MYCFACWVGPFLLQYRICESHVVPVSPHLQFDTEVMAIGIAFPTATRSKARIRTMVANKHTCQIDEIVDRFNEGGEKMEMR
jgi:hypothetical protein